MAVGYDRGQRWMRLLRDIAGGPKALIQLGSLLSSSSHSLCNLKALSLLPNSASFSKRKTVKCNCCLCADNSPSICLPYLLLNLFPEFQPTHHSFPFGCPASTLRTELITFFPHESFYVFHLHKCHHHSPCCPSQTPE